MIRSGLLYWSGLLPQQFGKFRQPLRMGGPGRGGHQIVVNMRLIDTDVGKMSAAEPHFRRAGRIGAAGAAFNTPQPPTAEGRGKRQQ